MRIGIDARELGGRATGVGRYLGGLLAEWAADERARRHEFVLYAAEPIEPNKRSTPSFGERGGDETGARPLLDARRFPTRLVAGPPGTWWEQVRLPRVAARDRLDVFFAPAYTAPLRIEVPTVLAVHDLSFVAHPEWFRTREGVRRRWLTRRAALRARAIITISEFSRRELIERLGVAGPHIHVIPPGVHLTETGGPRLDRVLYVGSIFNRRHVPDLIRAFGRVARTHPDASMDIVGDNRSHPLEDIRQTISLEGLDSRVRWHEYASDDELRDLYARARAFAFLSEYEGLGLTPLEALAAGVPAVLLDTPVARESCGDAALYVPVNDLAATVHALELALFDEDTRARVLAAAPAALAKYSWPRAARDTLAVLEAAGGSD